MFVLAFVSMSHCVSALSLFEYENESVFWHEFKYSVLSDEVASLLMGQSFQIIQC